MIVQHNLKAMNAQNNNKNNNNAISKSLQKLSSGFKINSASDDSAGLSISEKMRSQITGMNMAQKNAEDGNSLTETADGAMQEMHSMVDRMIELATQSANGTYDDNVDRNNLQREMDHLKGEMERISATTNFNGIPLLDGTCGTTGQFTYNFSADQIADGMFTKTNAVASTFNMGGNFTALNPGETGVFRFEYTNEAGGSQNFNVKIKSENGKAMYSLNGGASWKATAEATPGDVIPDSSVTKVLKEAIDASDLGRTMSSVIAPPSQIHFTGDRDGAPRPTLNAVKQGIDPNAPANIPLNTTSGKRESGSIDTSKVPPYDGTPASAAKAVFSIDGKKFAYLKKGVDMNMARRLLGHDVSIVPMDGAGTVPTAIDAANMANTISGTLFSTKCTTVGNTINFVAGNGLTLQVGDTGDAYNRFEIPIESMDLSSLGIKLVGVSTIGDANYSISRLKDAKTLISMNRGTLGAASNRLQHTMNVLGNTGTNISASESRIRDVDMAKEMMVYTKSSILSQSSQAMLAQANQYPQGVLQLLQ